MASTVDALVENIISEARDYGSNAFDDATSLVSNAQAYASGSTLINVGQLSFSFSDLPSIEAAPPARFTDSYVAPVGKPSLGTLETLYVPDTPTFDDAPSALDVTTLFTFDIPVYDVGEFQETVPSVNTDISFPEAPILAYPDVPEASTVTLRDAPQVTLPSFDTTLLDVETPSVPVDIVERFETAYGSALPQMRSYIDSMVDGWYAKYSPQYSEALAALEAKIAEGLAGGTALTDAVEQAMFDRARARAEEEQRRMDDELERGLTVRGYEAPPGALVAGRLQNRRVTAANVSRVAVEAVVERAKLEYQHVQFLITASSQLRQTLIGAAMQYMSGLVSVNGQAVQYAQAIAQTLAAVYNLLLDRYKAQLSAAEPYIRLFETQLKVALADIEVYQAELQAAEIQKNIEKINVDIYRERIAGERAKVDFYMAQLQGIQTQLEAQRLQVAVFGEQVQAYAARVQAKTAEYGAYKAAVDGDSAKVQAYGQVVQAYEAKVNATRAQADVEIAHSQAVSEHNRNIVEQFKAELQGYLGEVDAEKTRFASSVDAYRAAIEAYKADLGGDVAVLTAELDRTRLELQADMANFEGRIKTAVAQADIFVARAKLRADTAAAGANTLGSLASAAIGAQNTMVEVGQKIVSSGG